MDNVFDRIRNRTSWKTRLKVWVEMRILLIQYKVNKMKINWLRLLVFVVLGYVILTGLDTLHIYIHPVIKYPLVAGILYLLQGNEPIITKKDDEL